MTDPLVCAIMLTKDRPEMAKRAVECFRKQTYQNKKLLIWDTGERTCAEYSDDCKAVEHVWPNYGRRKRVPIGELRNNANKYAFASYLDKPDIIIHLDSDDWSHPNRIAEQVALLQASGKQAVGYREMLFWDSRKGERQIKAHQSIIDGRKMMVLDEPLNLAADAIGEAWLYRNNDPRYCLGTSLCYWRKTWEVKPFNPKLPERRGGTGEDTEWIRDLDTLGVSSLTWDKYASARDQPADEPRMIASIHGSNTQDYRGIEKAPGSWTRVPEWDQHCRKVMSL